MVESQVETTPNTTNEDKKEEVSFLIKEWRAFKKEMKTNWSEKEKKAAPIDFDGIAKEWKYTPENKNHWNNQKEKPEGESCSPLFYTVLLGIATTLIPNCFMVLDFKASYEYLNGTWYYKRDGIDQVEVNSTYTTNDTKKLLQTGICQNTTYPGYVYCFEQDIIWGILTLALDFVPGIFWSLGIFIQIAIYLRAKYPDTYGKTWMLFFFFMPLAIISMVTFPIQLIIVSIIACFNLQDHWQILYTKIGIADGMFNAFPQYLLSFFIFFVRADRFPTPFQMLAAFSSLLMLVWTRIDSLLMDRGGVHLSTGQYVWWICRFAPMFLFNSAFKLGSISLTIAMLRYNAIWIYGTISIIWCLLQLLFNEQCLPRGAYFLTLGSALHSVSVAHISDEIKMIDTKKHLKDNIMWVTKLTDMHLKMNMWVQNLFWFFLNAAIIITLTVLPDIKFPVFWPFISEIVSFNESAVFHGLYIIAPVILTTGVISLLLLWFCDFDRSDRNMIKRASQFKHEESISANYTVDPDKEVFSEFPGWFHDEANCPACVFTKSQKSSAWHRYITADIGTEEKVVGRLTQTMFPLMNLWQNSVDKNVA